LPGVSPKFQNGVGRFWFRRSRNEDRIKTSRAKVEVNEAAVEITLFVVNDSAMSRDLLIGETFLNNKLVAFVNIENKFVIGLADRAVC
jgi:hypothetical protein